MKLTINARNMVVTPGITQRIEKKTYTMSKYLLPETEMQVRMRKDKNDTRAVEITVPMGNNVILRSEAVDQNLFVAIDQALARILTVKIRRGIYPLTSDMIRTEE